jgi:hypothetical protein
MNYRTIVIICFSKLGIRNKRLLTLWRYELPDHCYYLFLKAGVRDKRLLTLWRYELPDYGYYLFLKAGVRNKRLLTLWRYELTDHDYYFFCDLASFPERTGTFEQSLFVRTAKINAFLFPAIANPYFF